MLSNRELAQVRRETVWASVFTERYFKLLKDHPPIVPNLEDFSRIADQCVIEAAAYANDVTRRVREMELREAGEMS